MYLSRIIEEGTVVEIFNNPCHPYSKALLSSVLFPDPRAKRTVFTLKGEIPSPIDLPKGCYFYSRCQERSEKCLNEYPNRINLGKDHFVSCWKFNSNEDLGNKEAITAVEEKLI